MTANALENTSAGQQQQHIVHGSRWCTRRGLWDSYRLFVQNTAVVLQNLDDSAQQFKSEGGGDVVDGGEHEEQAVLQLRNTVHLRHSVRSSSKLRGQAVAPRLCPQQG
jgi:hypothetical protein